MSYPDAKYPSEKVTTQDMPERVDGVDTILAEHINKLQQEVIAIQQELGVLPKGDAADVATRIGAHLGEYANHGNLKNKIINGNFAINQRMASTKAQSLGVYGYDRWKGYYGDSLAQVVEALPAGTYTLSWEGGGTGALDGQSGTSPITKTVTAGNTSVIVPATAEKVQLEEGEYATPFEHRFIGLELMLCQRYCQVYGDGENYRHFALGMFSSATVCRAHLPLSIPMRTIPTLTTVGRFCVYHGGTKFVASNVGFSSLGTTAAIVTFEITVSGAPEGGVGRFQGDGDGARIILSAEL